MNILMKQRKICCNFHFLLLYAIERFVVHVTESFTYDLNILPSLVVAQANARCICVAAISCEHYCT